MSQQRQVSSNLEPDCAETAIVDGLLILIDASPGVEGAHTH
jgi:hypothetical protein